MIYHSDMIYDTSNPLQKEQFKVRSARLSESGKIVELTEKKPKRTLSQNSYLWLLIGYWASQTGYTKDESEAIYKNVNRDIYLIEKDIAGIKVPYVRHTYELNTSEMTISIEKWRNWSAMNEAFPVYLPAPDEEDILIYAQQCIEQNQEFI